MRWALAFVTHRAMIRRMRGASLAIAMLLGGCILDHHQDPISDPEPVASVQPHTCTADITLDGSIGAATP